MEMLDAVGGKMGFFQLGFLDWSQWSFLSGKSSSLVGDKRRPLEPELEVSFERAWLSAP